MLSGVSAGDSIPGTAKEGAPGHLVVIICLELEALALLLQ
jgi:hypothetical protein